MDNRWSVSDSVDAVGERVPFGPAGDTLPASFTGYAVYARNPVALSLRASFDSDRVRLDELTITSRNNRGLTVRDVVGLEVGAVVRDVSRQAVQPGHGAHVGHRPGKRPTPDELQLVAAVYWFHYVTWGRPRQAVMAVWDLPSATASRWLRKCRDLYVMPEVD